MIDQENSFSTLNIPDSVLSVAYKYQRGLQNFNKIGSSQMMIARLESGALLQRTTGKSNQDYMLKLKNEQIVHRHRLNIPYDPIRNGRKRVLRPQSKGSGIGRWKDKTDKTAGLANSTGTMTIIHDLQDF